MTTLENLNISPEQMAEIDLRITEVLSVCSPFKNDGYSEKTFRSLARFWLAVPILLETYDISHDGTAIKSDYVIDVRPDQVRDDVVPFAEFVMVCGGGRSTWAMFCCDAYKDDYNNMNEEFKMEVVPELVENFVSGMHIVERQRSNRSIIDAFSI